MKNTIVIKYAPQSIKSQYFFLTDEDASIVTEHLSNFTSSKEFQVTLEGDIEAIAEEVFDITNNPSRFDEFLALNVGSSIPVSSGDVVNVNGVDILCKAIGWEKL